MCGLVVQIQLKYDNTISGHGAHQRKSTANDDYDVQRHHHELPESSKVPTAFHLPEVSHQIYSETALLAYSKNTFFLTGSFWYYKTWATRLRPAQRNAITSVEIEPSYLPHLIAYPLRKSLKQRLQGALQALRHVYISRVVLAYFRRGGISGSIEDPHRDGAQGTGRC